MPLEHGSSKEAIANNISTEEAAGKPHAQAVAIALNTASDQAPTMQAAGVVFLAGNRVLLLKRADNGEWGLPGGGVEDGETPFAAALREVLEETGHTVDPLQGQITQVAVVDNPDGCRFTCYSQSIADVFPVTVCTESVGMVWHDLGAPWPGPMFMCTPALIEIARGAVAMDYADTAREIDNNGFVEIKRNPLSKVGVFPYLGKSIPGADPAAIVMVYRPAEELADPQTIDSFKLTPWINDHTMLGAVPGGVPAEQKGVQGVIGQDVFFEDDTLYGNLKLFSQEHATRINDGKTPLSLGYRCRYEYAPGVFNGQEYTHIQRCIRGNHLASVNDGRMGTEVAVLDHFSFTLDAKDVYTMADPEKKPDDTGTAAAPATAKDGEMTLAELTATVKAIAPQIAAMNEALAALNKPAAPAAADAAPPAPTVDAAAMDEAVNKGVAAALASLKSRDALAARLSQHVGAFDHSDMTHGDVVKYGVEKLGIKPAAGQEAVYLAAYLDARPVSHRAYTAPAAEAMDGADKTPAFLAEAGFTAS